MSDYIALEVQGINREQGIALLSDGQTIPITSCANEDGVCDVEDATVCVCGPCFDGKWYVVNLLEYGDLKFVEWRRNRAKPKSSV